MGWLEHIIFAMAPLGILTAIVSAIRVGGPSWLRAVIGRARENRAMVEVELMSSTSHEVCELWNGQGIIRTMGKAEVQQIVYLEEFQADEETFGLYTVESALKDGYLTSEGTYVERHELCSFALIAHLLTTYCSVRGPTGLKDSEPDIQDSEPDIQDSKHIPTPVWTGSQGLGAQCRIESGVRTKHC